MRDAMHFTLHMQEQECTVLDSSVSLRSFDSIRPTFSRREGRIERLTRMATIGTKGSNDASLQLRFFYCQNGLSFNTTRPGPFRGHQRVFEHGQDGCPFGWARQIFASDLHDRRIWPREEVVVPPWIKLLPVVSNRINR
eukprot:scaffold9316_cov70-Skeletonema_dohrnii-CCMP3373.AAC.1